MPNDPTLHIIMVCAGSGIAPFRAFWQHRKNKRGYKKTSAWLYYGCRYRHFYIYYNSELQTVTHVILFRRSFLWEGVAKRDMLINKGPVVIE